MRFISLNKFQPYLAHYRVIQWLIEFNHWDKVSYPIATISVYNYQNTLLAPKCKEEVPQNCSSNTYFVKTFIKHRHKYT